MGISSAVLWWEEWQLRVLVLASLIVQYVLLVTSMLRKFPMKPGVRLILWLAYLGGDAIAIYALAILFNRHKIQDRSHGVLEVFWAPILLIHLAGRDSITAFDIEDNELWTRHLLVAVSQVTVAVYVFWKSWPGNDKRLLQEAILVFVIGVLKCLEKPWTLNSASINSLASSRRAVRRMIHAQRPNMNLLQDFVEKAKIKNPDLASVRLKPKKDVTPYNLFVDLASPSAADRIRTLQVFSALDENYVYDFLQNWLSDAFHVFYTKENFYNDNTARDELRYRGDVAWPSQSDWRGISQALLREFFGVMLRGAAANLLFASIFLFHYSRREAYSDKDIKVTYALLCGTFSLEAYSIGFAMVRYLREELNEEEDKSQTENTTNEDTKKKRGTDHRMLDDKVSQYNLIGFFVRQKKHYLLMSILGLLKCRDFFHQRWCMESSSSSRRITKLVLQHLKGGWEDHIKDASCYKEFNDGRGQLTLRSEECYDKLAWTIVGPFDESVLLWHLATDFCYYRTGASAHGSQCTQDPCGHTCHDSCHRKRAVQCRDMSNYMVYLLYVNPEMLMAGSRRRLFTAAYKGLKSIIKEGNRPLDESVIAEKIIAAVEREGSPPDVSEAGIIHDAWAISKVLLDMPAEQTWKVIGGVWVEMLCFSAVRCRGYLHAKALGTGTEYLTYVWLLSYQMGMETLADRLQRVDLPKEEENGAGDSSSHVSRAAGEEGAGSLSSQDNCDQRTSQDKNAAGQEEGAGPSSSQGNYDQWTSQVNNATGEGATGPSSSQDHCNQWNSKDNNATGEDIV